MPVSPIPRLRVWPGKTAAPAVVKTVQRDATGRIAKVIQEEQPHQERTDSIPDDVLAVHEIGHVLVATALGFHVKAVAICPETGRGRMEYDPKPGATYNDYFALVLAGPIAVRLEYPDGAGAAALGK